MPDSKTVCVSARELSFAFDFVSGSAPFENSAYVCFDTGKIFWQSMSVDVEEEDSLPDDLESSDRYIPIPHKNDLELGRRLALAFVDQEIPDDDRTVADFFRQRGAYSRFKDLLHARGVLEKWYEFEQLATEKALREWCEENHIQLVEEES